jgi:hypothetical protein
MRGVVVEIRMLGGDVLSRDASVRRTENTHHGQGLDEKPEILEKGKQSKQLQAREPGNSQKKSRKKGKTYTMRRSTR